MPKVKVEYYTHNPDSNTWNEVLVLGRAGKSTNRIKSWFNLKDISQNKHISVDFNNKVWKKMVDILISHVEIVLAKQTELNNWINDNMKKEVQDKRPKLISARLVFSQKQKDGKTVCKVRLVVRGFKEENLSANLSDNLKII